ncbi:MAG: Maf family protein [Acidimicrobiales bacterium]
MSVPTRRLVLASSSAARLGLLRDAGFDPVVVVSGVDEAAVAGGTSETGEARGGPRRGQGRGGGGTAGGRRQPRPRLRLGLRVRGRRLGKPGSPAEARGRIRRMRGARGAAHRASPHRHRLSRAGLGVAATTVCFAPMTDAEVDAYVATGEPLEVAGSFTLDGRAAPFVRRVEVTRPTSSASRCRCCESC